MKLCTTCNGPGPFGPKKGAKDGRKNECKKCLAKKQEDYRGEHPDSWRRWADKNKEYLRARDAARYASDPEREMARVRAWQVANPREVRKYQLRSNLRKYNLTPENLRALYDRQGGMCPVCGLLLYEGRTGMQVDHDHMTGVIRGLTCHLCNLMLGHFKDSVESLQRAIVYLLTEPPYLPTSTWPRIPYKRTGLCRCGTIRDRPPHPWCIKCVQAYNLWYRFQISPDTLDKLIASQGGACAICQTSLQKKSMHIDHDHASSRIRGVLCRECNLALGHSRDDIGILQSAMAYLARD